MEPMTTDLAALIARAEAGDIDATLRASAELTRAGKHEQALNYLIRASNGGHVVAQATLGLRMVTGRMAPLDPVKGIELIRASAIAGNPEALSYLSSLAASGRKRLNSTTSAAANRGSAQAPDACGAHPPRTLPGCRPTQRASERRIPSSGSTR